MMRIRPNLPWWLRGIAKWFNARAEAIDPIKINRPAAAPPTRLYLTSKSAAEAIIERARGTHA